MRIGPTVIVLLAVAGCGSKGSVTFTIRPPTLDVLNPITDQVSEYALKHFDGTLVGVASEAPGSPDSLALGPLVQQTTPADLVMTVLSGSQLLGMARIRDVVIVNGVRRDYAVDVRKSLITIGSALPDEALAAGNPPNSPQAGRILDPTTNQDLAASTAANHPALPAATSAAASTWDGRFLLTANAKGVSVIDTGSGATVGLAPLSFAAAKLAVGARDSAVVAINAGANGSVTIFPDVTALTTSPASAPSMLVPISGEPRSAVFDASGKRAFILTGGATTDPCNGTLPAPNSIVAIGLDGAVQGTWTLPAFASDLTVDSSSGAVLVSEAIGNRVSTLDVNQPFGAVTPTKLVDATCPSALRAANGALYVVTAERPSADSTEFILQRILANGTATRLSFSGPLYNENVTSVPGPDGNTSLNFGIRPPAIYAYDMAVTPDGSTAVFATRARYVEAPAQSFKLFGTTATADVCKPDIDIVEYGLYTMDTRTGTASYESRSLIVLKNDSATGAVCVNCTISNVPDIAIGCASTPGDRAAGLAAVFGGP